MGLFKRFTALAVTPVAAAVAARMKSASGGHLHSQQAVSAYDKFFKNVTRADTDAALSAIGIARHQLEMLLDDDEIDEKVERRLENLTQAEYTLSPSEGDTAKLVFEQLDLCLDQILTASISAKLYGYSVCEYEWTSDEMEKVVISRKYKEFSDDYETIYHYNDREITRQEYENLFLIGRRFVRTVTEKPLEWFEPTNDGRLLWFPQAGGRPVEVCLRSKYMLQQYRATYKNPRGRAILSRIYWLWFFKKNGWTFWSKYLERFGSPLLIGTTDGDPDEMAAELAAAHAQSIFTMPTGDKVDTVGNIGNGETFKAYDDAINRRLSRYLLGATLTAGTDTGGTYGQGKVHQSQQEIVFNGDKKFAAKYVQAFIDMVCKMNNVEAPEFAFKLNQGAQTELAQRDMMLVNQGLQLHPDYYSDAYNIDRRHIINVGAPRMLPTRRADSEDSAQSFLTFAANNRYTEEQQGLEAISAQLLLAKQQPIDPAAIEKVIKTSASVEDLEEGLYDLVGENLDKSAFAELLRSAVMASDMRGLVDETTGK